MLRLLLWRLVLFALPFAIYRLWWIRARQTHRPMGSTPWAWLVCAGALIVATSLLATSLLHTDNRGEAYVPAQASPDGHVSPGGFKRVDRAR